MAAMIELIRQNAKLTPEGDVGEIDGDPICDCQDSGGITVETRARFGFTAAPGSTDDPRLRRITEHLPPAYAQQLFDAHASGATEQQLAAIVAQGLQEMYFKDRGRRAQGLVVDLNTIDYLDLSY